MPWKIAVELIFVSPFLFLAFTFGAAETLHIMAEIQKDRIGPARAPQVAAGSIFEVQITPVPPINYVP